MSMSPEERRYTVIRQTGICPYAPSCFECPLPDCQANSNWAYGINLTPYDIEQKKKRSR